MNFSGSRRDCFSAHGEVVVGENVY